ncbi:YjjG family noncanonical pyrimidine nucleotidase [Flavobacterium dauae]|uniref:YjjG family noncanonical pyrimidine nucleotidase n=1 Tax=Flavobacterium dauae TaxID=1563479 RepID=UPI00101B51C6|nr:YjjG family noncanonical pyrimidine nucleotidase [Flavobacterium dauae]WLD23375.1 YjjG family noncanonical pyrimidine nucleotidase [Flavobacterium dauae]
MKAKEHITDLFFDLDHTIYDFDKNSSLTFHAVFSDLKLEGTQDFMTHFKPINDLYWEKYAREEITHDFLRYGRLKDTFNAIELAVSDEHIYHIADYFIENLTNYNHVFQGAYETLDQLKSKYRLHIITNGPEKVQEKKLKNSKLDHYFETVTNSEKAGVKKPDPVIFQYALSQANVRPQNSLMIGDNIKADIHGALNVGMDVIWFNEFRLKNTDNITEIHQLNQLLDLL